ncbi:GNAT family N-acetyltransferase [Aurantimonas sp. VKM B-3413]|uniref:GNAT family N-acetyltransferase n=1 Tax=Aurantimonas sp. VKM B-3413 TaxID=2779401 RepID=UPI001E555CD3|nr:GNAT family protein [Aurantimonas sp. VKM B-3413]MCB8839164.1 GNAT family N-acetyltransferase [Aurantimonas sp. VKM B-3413]
MSVIDHFSRPQIPALAGDGVTLRMPRRSDYTLWHDLRSDSREFLRPWEPMWTTDELSWAAYRQRVRRYNQEAREGTGYTFFLFDEAGTTLYGGITVGHIRRGVAQCCTLGYWMGERYAGAGLMFRAVETIKMFVFDLEGLHRIEAACLPSNARSIRLLEKCGFTREGLLRSYLKIAGRWEDHCLYALTAEEWSCSKATERARAAAPAA